MIVLVLLVILRRGIRALAQRQCPPTNPADGCSLPIAPVATCAVSSAASPREAAQIFNLTPHDQGERVSPITIDARLKAGAYLSCEGKLWLNLGPDRDDKGMVTGDYVLENAKGVHSAVGGRGVWLHPKIYVTSTWIVQNYQLAREAPSSDVPAHLDAEMNKHLQSAGLAGRASGF